MLCLFMSFAVYMGCQNTDNPVADSSQRSSTNTLNETNTFAEAKAKIAKLRPQMEAEKVQLMAKYNQASVVVPKKRSVNSIAGSKITVPDDFPTIQEAVFAASPGEKIKVKASGSPYTEEVFVPVPDIRITAEGDVTVIGGFIVAADDVQIDHFNIGGDLNVGFAGLSLRESLVQKSKTIPFLMPFSDFFASGAMIARLRITQFHYVFLE